MYLDNKIPTEWPRRADESTYRKYAKLHSWHLEEAASLVAGYEPRRDTQCFPIDGKPGTADQPEIPPPYEGAMTWNELLHGAIGKVLSLYARYRRVPDWGFTDDMLYVSPRDFLAFCAEHDVPVPSDLVKCFPSDWIATRANTSSSASSQREALYREYTVQVATDLEKKRAPRVTVALLQETVERRFGDSARTVASRTFQSYLRRWRQDKKLGELLASVLRGVAGRLSEDEEIEINRRVLAGMSGVTPSRRPPKKKSRK